MKEIMTPLSLLITALAAWLNERNNETIDFLREQVETYQEIAGTGRLPFTDGQRRRLAMLFLITFGTFVTDVRRESPWPPRRSNTPSTRFGKG